MKKITNITSTADIIEFIKEYQPLIDKAYNVLSDRFFTADIEENIEYYESLMENYTDIPEWIKAQTETDNRKFYFDVDPETGAVFIEPSEDYEICNLSEEVIDNLIDNDVDLEELQIALKEDVYYD